MEPLILVPLLFTLPGRFRRAQGSGHSALRVASMQSPCVPGSRHGPRSRSVGRNIGSGTWFPVLRFDAADGRQIGTEAMYGRRPAPARRGDDVTVLYDPADPTRAALEGKFGGGVLGVMLVMGLLFATRGLIIGGIALLVTDRL